MTHLASIYGHDVIGETTVCTFDLNGLRGRTELIRERSRYIWKLISLLEWAKQGDREAISLIQESLLPDAPYLAFAKVYIAPSLAELSWTLPVDGK